ncbi:MAG: NAD(P)H-dependent oxidoreductase [Deltaproteobacteria bacterium]|nr:NAD(P)H-dependent oxidoreductase [Deltaproteobacteria bacterium]
MFVLGLQGSPRKKGNTRFLLSAFLEESRRLGANTQMIEVCQKKIDPCMEYVLCEKKGICPIDDDMKHEIYPLLRKADVIVTATPIFFYNTTAQLKALIDRSQTLWARKYKLHLTDPNRKWRRGYTLAVGATRGKNLFDGLHLTMKYFYDAVGAEYVGSLTYREIEKPGDMERHATLRDDVQAAVATLLEPFQGRKKILFTCRENACLSQMAGAFAQILAGDKLDVLTAGSQPAEKLNPLMVEAMQEKGIDMGFRQTASINAVLTTEKPGLIISMGRDDTAVVLDGIPRELWNFTAPEDLNAARRVRDAIEARVAEFIKGMA